MNNSPVIYAIVVTYNGAKWVDKCFGSLLNSNIPIKVLAIDNASTDNTVELIKRKYTDVEILENRTNLGFGKANNIGLARVLNENVEYAFLLNQDAWIASDTIQKLIKVHLLHSELGILSPVPYDGEGLNLDRQFNLYYKEPHDLSKIDLNDKKLTPYKVPFINAACWLVPLNTIKKVGFFSSLFFQRGEDKDYTQRCEFHNVKVAFISGCNYYHDRTHVWEQSYPKNKLLKSVKARIVVLLNNINNPPYKRLLEIGIFLRTLVINKKISRFQAFWFIVLYCIKAFHIISYSKKYKIEYFK